VTILSYVYRFISNFILLAMVYFALNFIDPSKYQQRATLAFLVLVYASMRAVSALRSFYFYQRIERLELDVRRSIGNTGDGGPRKQLVTEVAGLRRGREMKAYIDLLFLSLVILLCVSRIVLN